MNRISSLVLLVMAMLVTSNCFAKTGDSVEVTKFRWVKVMNQEVVFSGNTEYIYGEICSIKCGGEIVSIDETDDGVLVHYTTQNNEKVYGASCPSGIIFWISREDLSKFGLEPEPSENQ